MQTMFHDGPWDGRTIEESDRKNLIRMFHGRETMHIYERGSDGHFYYCHPLPADSLRDTHYADLN